MSNLYTKDSGDDFLALADSTDEVGNYIGEIKPEILEPIDLDPIKPEQVKTIEVGYRGIVSRGFYVDLTAYYNLYSNFIGNVRAYQLLSDTAIAGEETGVDAMLGHSDATETYEIFQYRANAKSNVSTYGLTTGLAYYFASKYTAKFNYTFSNIDTTGLDSEIIPGFNTPKHKFNIGLEGKRLWKNLGFGVNYKWTDSFYWESSFGDGPVPSYSTIDLQINYEFKDPLITARAGVANLLGTDRVEAYGSPTIGRFIYASLAYGLH